MPLIIKRGDGEKSGGQIISSILTDRASKIERGTHEINQNHLNKKVETVSLMFDTSFKRPLELRALNGMGEEEIGLTETFSLEIQRTKRSINVSPEIKLEVPQNETNS